MAQLWLKIFQGIVTSIAKKPYILVIFQGWGVGGVGTPCQALWIRAWLEYVCLLGWIRQLSLFSRRRVN